MIAGSRTTRASGAHFARPFKRIEDGHRARGMDGRQLRQLSRMRLREARALYQARHAPGAYYLAGYAAECALKACIARNMIRYDFPSRKILADGHTHDLEKLVVIAGLQRRLGDAVAADPRLGANWRTVRDWSPDKRYELSLALPMARDILLALTSPRHGVLSWAGNYW